MNGWTLEYVRSLPLDVYLVLIDEMQKESRDPDDVMDPGPEPEWP